MEYSEIIQKNCDEHSRVTWWPKCAYHYSDVTNIVNILSTGQLYSRTDATRLNIMQNDNASRQVIDMTDAGVVSKVRFYFRPLTPTQYYNEGYKHSQLRYDGDEKANIPVPVFLLFDLEKVLSLPGVQFSETSQAGHGAKTFSGVEAFNILNFDAIYSDGYENAEANRPFRQAEIVHCGTFPVEPYLKMIICRNSTDRTTLLTLLKEKDQRAYRKYREKVIVHRDKAFLNNGLYVGNCQYHKSSLSLTFSDSYQKQKYTERMKDKLGISQLSPILLCVECRWMSGEKLVHQETFSTHIDYERTKGIVVKKMPTFSQAKELWIRVLLDNDLVCYVKQPLAPSEVIK